MGLLAFFYFISLILIYAQAWHYFGVFELAKKKKKKAASEAINLEDRIQARVQVCFSDCFSTATCMVACMFMHLIYIQMDVCVCQCVYISLLLLGFTRRQPACFGSTPWSHILPLWSVPPADVILEVNGDNRLNAETTSTSEQMGWCYFYNPFLQKLMQDKVQGH